MTDVFLSYSRDDQATARRFAEGIEREGFSVWWDQALDAGENFDRVTEQALKSAKAVVVLWSTKSVDSKWVRSEATQADRYGTLVPVTIEPCTRPIMFELNHTANLAGWSGDATDPRWVSFVGGLKRSTGNSAARDIGAIPSITAAPRLRRPSPAVIPWIAVTILIAIAAGIFIYMQSRGVDTAAAHVEPSIAVLPFENISADPSQEYFADGITEEILNSLAGIPDPNLKVTARTSVFALKGKEIDPREIGKTLGVANILAGKVRKDDDQLRITAQLIDAKTGYTRWSKQFDKPLSGIFAIQEEIARSVAEVLQVSLGVGELGRDPFMTRSVEAYDAYLAGAQGSCLQTTSDALHECLDQLERATALDPDFVMAWRHVHEMYSSPISAIFLQDLPAQLRQQKAETALREIQRLAPDSYIYHQMLSRLAFDKGLWSEARNEYALATKKASTLGIRLGADADLPLSLGMFREAIAILELERARDPLNFSIAVRLGEAYADFGDFRKAFTEWDRGMGLEGGEAFLLGSSVIAALATRDRAQIDRRMMAADGLDRVLPFVWPLLDQPKAALAELRAFIANAKVQGDEAELPLIVPHWLAYFGDTGGALEILQSGSKIQAPAWTLLFVWRPIMKDVRKLPGFKDLMRDLGVVEQWREFGWPDLCKPVGDTDFECN